MGFVNEIIEGKDIERYYSFNLIGPYTKRKLEPWKWTIDRERDAVFICLELGRDEEHPNYYVFIWKNKIISIQAYLKNDYEKALYWNLDRIGMPESLKEQQDAVIELILEAFRAYGYLYRNQNHAPDTIFFTNVAEPSFYKEEK